MGIEQTLRADQTAAMKARDTERLNAIRSVQAEVATAKSAPGFAGDVDDDLYIRTITTYVKRISKSKIEYDAMGERGVEQSEKLAFEIEYLAQYLPTVLDEAATRSLVDATIEGLGSAAPLQIGMVIGAVMRSGEDLDGSLVSRIVNERLAAD